MQLVPPHINHAYITVHMQPYVTMHMQPSIHATGSTPFQLDNYTGWQVQVRSHALVVLALVVLVLGART